jgi:CIC family chloride channel protein
MGVLFAGFLRAPMTSVFMVLEVSGNYSIIVPVIVANTIAYVISRALMPAPIFDVLSRQDGLELPSMEEQREESILRVEDAMRSAPAFVFDAGETIASGAQRAETGDAGDVLLVRLTAGGWSSVTREELNSLMEQGKGGEMLATILAGGGQIPYLHPDHPLDMALRYVDRWPLVPVVNRANLRQIEGVISQRDVLERYRDYDGA